MRIYCYVDLFRIDGPIAIKYHGLNESARWKLTKRHPEITSDLWRMGKKVEKGAFYLLFRDRPVVDPDKTARQ